MTSPEAGGSAETRPEQTVAGFFNGKVQQLLQDNIEFVMSGSSRASRSFQVLHLIDANPQGGKPLRYHYAYELFDSDPRKPTLTHGILIARPYVIVGNKAWTGDSRHYFEQGNGLVVREDTHWRESSFEFLQGDIAEIAEGEDPEASRALNELQSDIFKLEQSQPIRPLSNLFDRRINLPE